MTWSRNVLFSLYCRNGETICNLTCWWLYCTIQLFDHNFHHVKKRFIMLNTMMENKSKIPTNILISFLRSWSHIPCSTTIILEEKLIFFFSAFYHSISHDEVFGHTSHKKVARWKIVATSNLRELSPDY